MPYAFEKVRATMTCGLSIATGMCVSWSGSVT